MYFLLIRTAKKMEERKCWEIICPAAIIYSDAGKFWNIRNSGEAAEVKILLIKLKFQVQSRLGPVSKFKIEFQASFNWWNPQNSYFSMTTYQRRGTTPLLFQIVLLSCKKSEAVEEGKIKFYLILSKKWSQLTVLPRRSISGCKTSNLPKVESRKFQFFKLKLISNLTFPRKNFKETRKLPKLSKSKKQSKFFLFQI